MRICELFDPKSSYPLQWGTSSFGPVAITTDKEGREIQISFWNLVRGQAIVIDFSREGRYTITGQGEAIQIFSTVLAALAEYLKTSSPKYIVFSAEEPSRKRLYNRLSKKLEQTHGYNRVSPDDYMNVWAIKNLIQVQGSSKEFFVLKREGSEDA